MVSPSLKPETIRQLQAIAERERYSLEELLLLFIENADEILSLLNDDQPLSGQVRGTVGIKLVKASDAMNYHSGKLDIVERSREILEAEYADYIHNRKVRDAE